jgi:putative ABC transport system permease protein
VGALMLSQMMNKMLYGVRPTDPVTFCAVGVVLGLVSLLAIFVPARRATMVEPVTALRTE